MASSRARATSIRTGLRVGPCAVGERMKELEGLVRKLAVGAMCKAAANKWPPAACSSWAPGSLGSAGEGDLGAGISHSRLGSVVDFRS